MSPCPAGTFAYVIRTGDTIWTLGRRYHTRPEVIAGINPKVDIGNLQTGQVIRIPGTDTKQHPRGSFVYTVLTGDTLYKIVERFNVQPEAVISDNPDIDFENLQIGQSVFIPLIKPWWYAKGAFAYSIRSGDTCSKLVRRFGISVEALQAANPGVNWNDLHTGQVICIPGLANHRTES